MVRERGHPDLDPLAVAAVVPLGPGRQYGRDSGQRLETLCGTICRLISFIWSVANGPGIRNTYIILFCPDYFSTGKVWSREWSRQNWGRLRLEIWLRRLKIKTAPAQKTLRNSSGFRDFAKTAPVWRILEKSLALATAPIWNEGADES